MPGPFSESEMDNITGMIQQTGKDIKSIRKDHEFRLEELEKSLNRPVRGAGPIDGEGFDFKGIEDNPEHTKTFCDNFLKKGHADGLIEHQKAMSIGVPADGGYAVPVQLDREIANLMRDGSAMRRLCTVKQVHTESYKKIMNLHGAGSGWVSETVARPSTATPTIEEVTPYMGEVYSNPQITQRAIEDMFFNAGNWLVEELSTGFSEQENTAFIVGNGTDQPRGFLDYPSTTQSDTARAFGTLEHMVSASATVIAPDELIDLIYKLKAKHRKGAQWLMNSVTASALRKLKDNDGNYLWQQGIKEGQPDVLLGHRVEIDEAMPDMGSDSTPIAFGNWKAGYYIIDRISTVLRDPYSNKPYIGFYARKRVGGMLVDSEAIKLLQMAV